MNAGSDVLSRYHGRGLVYFWALNDRLERPELESMLLGFAQAKVAAICLHPRSGLELPYSSDDWFATIAWICRRAAELHLTVWLYDDDPYPSGGVGGRLVMEHPEFIGRRIERFAAEATLQPEDNFTFPGGTLLWCGIVHRNGSVTDLSRRVGVLRTQWGTLNPWDSRYYYPQTPLYSCPRAWTHDLKMAIRMPALAPGDRLEAFVARPVAVNHGAATWPNLPDWLNPDATRRFLEFTYEPYRQTVGEFFGNTITSVFIDEPKFQDKMPWTPGLFEDFQARFGYDLRGRLHWLFEAAESEEAMTTRLDYRLWCRQRFEQAWLAPVAQWCRGQGLALLGHMSPEDDLVAQSGSLGNLMPLQTRMAMPGLDVIIPAVGDQRHPLLSVGVACAASVAQQQSRDGVVSELLALLGRNDEADIADAKRIVRWQMMMGVTTPVIHCAYQSMQGMRAIEAPPDYGPHSPRWAEMQAIHAQAAALQPLIAGARQEAPVAILWPMRTFNALYLDWTKDDTGLRDAFVTLLRRCLDAQVGVHVLDEEALWAADVTAGRVDLGRASYRHLLLPPMRVIHERSVAALNAFAQGGGDLRAADPLPGHVQYEHAPKLRRANFDWAARPASAMVDGLPRLIDSPEPVVDLRCTVWHHDQQRVRLLMNLRREPVTLRMGGQDVTLQGDELRVETSPAAAVGGR